MSSNLGLSFCETLPLMGQCLNKFHLNFTHLYIYFPSWNDTCKIICLCLVKGEKKVYFVLFKNVSAGTIHGKNVVAQFGYEVAQFGDLGAQF